MYGNWSFSTASDVPLFLPGPLNKVTGNVFVVVMAAVVAVLDEHSDLRPWRRPRSCMFSYFSEDLTAYLEAIRNGKDVVYALGMNMNAVFDTICANNFKEFARVFCPLCRRPWRPPVLCRLNM